MKWHWFWAAWGQALLARPSSAVERASAAVSPVQKVIQLLQDMLQKGTTEKHEEQVRYAAYKQFCEDTMSEKTEAVQKSSKQIEVLKAEISEYKTDSEMLTREIAKLDEDIASQTGDTKASTRVREIERADYEAMHGDLSTAIDALQQAIVLLKRQAHDRKQAQSLSQLRALKRLSLIPKEAKRAFELFLAQDPQEDVGLSMTAPEVAAYEFQSHGVIDLCQKLLDKFANERTTLEKKEMNARHAYEMLQKDLNAQIAEAKRDRAGKVGLQAQKLQAKADNEGDLDDTATRHSADEKYIGDLSATCKTKAGDFKARQQLRTEELATIEKAVEILSSSVVSENSVKYLESTTVPQAVSLVALRSTRHGPGHIQARAAEYLQGRARELESRLLQMLARRVSYDPFVKVKKMIKDLLVRLEGEASEEADHKSWCDGELTTNQRLRGEKTKAVEMLRVEIDELEASLAKISEDLGVLRTAVAELNKAIAEATKLRQQEQGANEQTIADAQQAQTALAQALTVLTNFYAANNEAPALVQQRQLKSAQMQTPELPLPAPPPIFDTPYTGMQAESGGVIGLLEVISSDFARLEAETSAFEAVAKKEYDKSTADARVDAAKKEKEIEHKQQKQLDETQALASKKSDLEGTQKELDTAVEYHDKLKPSCVDTGVSYEARVTRRKEEIESLQEALRILNGEDLAA